MFSQRRTVSDSQTKGDKMSDEQHHTASPAIEVHTPPHEIIEEKLRDEDFKPPYDKEKNPQASLEPEPLPHEEPQIDMRENPFDVIQDKSAGDDSDEGSETDEVDLFSPSWPSQRHQSEEMTDAPMLGGELPTNIDDSIGRHAKPVEPDSIESVQSGPNTANLFEEMETETLERSQAPESVSKGNKMSDEHHDIVSPAMEVQTPANTHEIIEAKLNDAEPEPLYDKENSLVSLKAESLLHEEPQIDTRENLVNLTQNKSAGDDSYKGSKTVEVDSSSPSQLPEEHQSEEITDALMPGGELPAGVNDSVAKLVEPEPSKSVESTPNQENLSEKTEIETLEKFHAPESDSKADSIITTPEEVIKPTEEISTERPSQSDSTLPTTSEPGVQHDDETKINIGALTTQEAGEKHQWDWDFLKAIVYGGLLESIASLGVISSAAASDVSTLNAVSLGLANLAGGLLVLIHNLVELKNKQQEKEQVDLYEEQLGKRGHFYLHATLALVSYIFVGILPPVLYGFTFMKSDNREYKLLIVAAASLVCIALLALGKAHVQGQKAYGKTLLRYLAVGIGASGLSYAVGIVIRKLLESLGLFGDSAFVSAHPFSSNLEVTSSRLSWASS